MFLHISSTKVIQLSIVYLNIQTKLTWNFSFISNSDIFFFQIICTMKFIHYYFHPGVKRVMRNFMAWCKENEGYWQWLIFYFDWYEIKPYMVIVTGGKYFEQKLRIMRDTRVCSQSSVKLTFSCTVLLKLWTWDGKYHTYNDDTNA